MAMAMPSVARRRGLLPRVFLLAVSAMLLARALAVDHSKFRTCEQTQFCRAFRFAARTHYAVSRSSVRADGDTLWFELREREAEQIPGQPKPKATASQQQVLQGRLQFVLGADASANPAIRLHVAEKWADASDPRARWENSDVLLDAAAMTRGLRQVTVAESGLHDDGLQDANSLLFKPAPSQSDVVVALHVAPFGVDVYVDGRKVMVTNAQGKFHFETRQERGATHASGTEAAATSTDIHHGKTIVDYGEDGLAIYSDGTVQQKAAEVEVNADATTTTTTESAATTTTDEGWEESFGGHTDKKKFGPSSIGLDIVFPDSPHGLYGIPEHASDFVLQDTVGWEHKVEGKSAVQVEVAKTDPYRLYNLDVFEYELGVPMALYGAIPLMLAPSEHSTVGVFWHNPSETFVDVATRDKTKFTHWMSESGVLDLFFLVGPTIPAFFSQYTSLTGRAQLPPLFAVGYHQCRWNYKNEDDVARVDAGFDQHLIPYDVLWLDIEHTNGKRYFTWDPHAFPTPVPMQEALARVGRRMVTIVDPHIKVDDDYIVHKQATELGMYVQDEEGKDFHGWCWPGDSAYVDFTSLKARRWWSSRFRYDAYEGSTSTLFTWNDMNEPSVFNGPEVSMRKTCVNRAGIEHREWHNLYGMYMQQATMEGQIVRQLPAALSEHDEIPMRKELHRPFVLGRSFFAGSQRFGAIWTGDNAAEWKHLKYATKMLLSLSSAALSFVGADVGGFFGNPDTELLTRWYQSAAWQPFFRGHAHHDSNRREPYVFGEPHTTRLREAIRARYAWLPYTYTLFHECATTGMPVLRALWMEFPQDAASFAEEDEFMLGSSVLVKPITDAGVEKTSVYLPGTPDDIWYHVFEGYRRYAGGQIHEDVPAPIDFTPVFQRGGSVVPRKQRVRRSSKLMQHDPLTLVITLDARREAKGQLFLDDEETFAYATDGSFTQVEWSVTTHGIESRVAQQQFTSLVWIERIEVYGFQGQLPTRVLHGDIALETTYDASHDVLVVRKPGVVAMDAWTLRFE